MLIYVYHIYISYIYHMFKPVSIQYYSIRDYKIPGLFCLLWLLLDDLFCVFGRWVWMTDWAAVAQVVECADH